MGRGAEVVEDTGFVLPKPGVEKEVRDVDT